LVESFFSGLLKPYRKAVLELEQRSNPDYVNFDGVKSLLETRAQVLLIYSEDDTLCKKDPHFDALKAGLSEKKNISFLLVNHKGHNPNYTVDAVQYLQEYGKAKTAFARKKKLLTPEGKKSFVDSFDWERMTTQDETVWKEIFALLEKS